jgi:hypothetical protein
MRPQADRERQEREWQQRERAKQGASGQPGGGGQPTWAIGPVLSEPSERREVTPAVLNVRAPELMPS